ncbi:MAG: hypothetical protein Q8P18_10990 [Pseudomonadota bacterium]|nr:hypothetical protein [Pseudomonadota bacterium]
MRPALPLLFLLAPLALLVACPALRDTPICRSTRTEIALDEVTPLGFSAADVLAHLAPQEDAALRWADGTVTDLSLDFAPGTTARFVDGTVEPPTSGAPMPEIAIVCDDYIEVDVAIGFATADGEFAEQLKSRIRAITADTGVIDAALALDALVGTFDLAPFVEAESWDDLTAWVHVDLTSDGRTRGYVAGTASGEEPCAEGEECTAWAEDVAVATWGEPAEE